MKHNSRNRSMFLSTSQDSKYIEASIHLNDITIHPSKEAKYLGVMLDKDLKFRTHISQAMEKGTRFPLAISSIIRSTWGPEYKYLQCLFTSVVALRMNYTAII